MRRAFTLILALMWLAAQTQLAKADEALEALKRYKSATALVVLPSEKGFGTAFCIDEMGLFATCAHVVGDVGPNGTVKLVLSPGEESEVSIPSKVLRIDKDKDLALLRADLPRPVPVFAIGDSEALVETNQITALGYPLGDLLAVRGHEYPSISVNVGRVTALRKSAGKVSAVQTDAVVNPGNSGGPIIDSAGNVVGIVEAGIPGRGINFAIPANMLQSMLAIPQIVLTPTTVTYENRHKNALIKAKIISVAKDKPKYDVELTLLPGKPAQRKIVLESLDATTFAVRMPPMPDETVACIVVDVKFDGGSIRCAVADQKVTLDNQTLKLSEIENIQPGEHGFSITTWSGNQSLGNHLSFGDGGTLKVELAGSVVNVVPEKISGLVASKPLPEGDRIPFTVTARANGTQVAELSGEIMITGGPKGPATASVTIAEEPAAELINVPEPPLQQDIVPITLPGKFSGVRTGGGGRYLLFHMKESRKLVIFDVSKAAIVKEIPVQSETLVYAAGADKFYIVLPDQRMVQRWSLDTFTREMSAPVDNDQPVREALIGQSSTGPLMLFSGGPALLLDTATLKRIPTEERPIGGDPQYDYRMRVSADGRSFVGWHNGIGPDGGTVMRLTSEGFTFSNAPGEASYNGRWKLPNADGRYMFSGSEIFDYAMRSLPADWLSRTTLIPCVDPRYFVAARHSAKSTQIMICSASDRRPIFQVHSMERLQKQDSGWENYQFYGQPRIQFVPSANVLVLLPESNDRVVLRRCSIDRELANLEDYLFVDSLSPIMGFRGATYTYPIQVRSKSGGEKYSLENGPEGMVVSETGRVAWHVPPDFSESSVPVVVTITDKSARQVIYNFDIYVDEPGAGTGKPRDKSRRFREH